MRSTFACLLIALTGAACSGSGGGFDGNFEVLGISVQSDALWEINRPIDIEFNKDVDFDTVNLNTIKITNETGEPVTGYFELGTLANGAPDLRVVRFKPRCPLLEDGTDAGFTPGGVQHEVLVVGKTTAGAVTVRSAAGDEVAESVAVGFSTPNASIGEDLFIDLVAGPPVVRVRGRSGVALDDGSATYLENERLPGARAFFVFDGGTGETALEGGAFESGVPLNHYSVLENQIAVVLALDQPVLATEGNISSEFIQFEYQGESNPRVWRPLPTTVELLENCSQSGAAVRARPLGILPRGARVRVILRTGFRDLAGNPTVSDQVGFALVSTATSGPAAARADELLEEFVVNADSAGSLEDGGGVPGLPRADWEGGQLRASFGFEGTGGPNGEFDWHLPPNGVVILDTTLAQITGGPDGLPTSQTFVENGVVDVRNVFIPATTTLVIQGPNPCTILASGTVTIAGEISVRGGNGQTAVTLNTNVPLQGAYGRAGGGSGGTGSPSTTSSVARGGSGNGAFDVPGLGGEGGESSFALGSVDARRAAGGGGGRFGPDVRYPFEGTSVPCQLLIGLDVESGFAGSAQGQSAVDPTRRARGGTASAGPFADGFDGNDFFGTLSSVDEDGVERLALGELAQLVAGAGGGGGGDASLTDNWPIVPFSPPGDDRGGGGGAGGGALAIYAVGAIEVLEGGRIDADGGAGGAGENTIFFDRVGGGGGGGSGGHIVLSSASYISIAGRATDAGFYYNDPMSGHQPRVLSAAGGQGGAGHENFGGSNDDGVTSWDVDAIPFAQFEGLEPPPLSNPLYPQFFPDFNDPEGPVLGAGGDGGPGLIQLHVDNPELNLRFPSEQLPVRDEGALLGFTPAYGAGLDVTPVCAPPPVGWSGPDEAAVLLPFLGGRSAARSRWIALGAGNVGPGGESTLDLLFGGTDESGSVLHEGEKVAALDPILQGLVLETAPATPYLASGAMGFVFALEDFESAGPGAALYTANPRLLRLCSLELTSPQGSTSGFPIAFADFEEDETLIHVTLDADAFEIAGLAEVPGTTLAIVPRFFRVSTDGELDSYPAASSVRIRFDATVADPSGAPDPNAAYSVREGDFAAAFDALANGTTWDFLRFQVDFDLNTDGTGTNFLTPRPALEFLRLPFGF